MKAILIPIDFSDGSMMSCKYAIHLAGDRPTKIVLLHIYPDQLMIPDSSFPAGIDTDTFLNNDFIVELRKQAVKNMLDFSKDVKSYLKNKNIKHIELDQKVTGGDPYWELHSIATIIIPELIVMGTHGDGKKGFLEGSMTEHIMNKLDIPVLAVPESVDTLRIQNIMYATNYSENDYNKIKTLLNIFRHPESNINIVHFELKGKAHENTNKMNALRNAVKVEFFDRNISFHTIDSDKKSTALKAFTSEYGINVIAFIAHKSNIFKNLFSSEIHKKDFFKLEIPMLALHE